jgi:hypothetical protein
MEFGVLQSLLIALRTSLKVEHDAAQPVRYNAVLAYLQALPSDVVYWLRKTGKLVDPESLNYQFNDLLSFCNYRANTLWVYSIESVETFEITTCPKFPWHIEARGRDAALWEWEGCVFEQFDLKKDLLFHVSIAEVSLGSVSRPDERARLLVHLALCGSILTLQFTEEDVPVWAVQLADHISEITPLDSMQGVEWNAITRDVLNELTHTRDPVYNWQPFLGGLRGSDFHKRPYQQLLTWDHQES